MSLDGYIAEPSGLPGPLFGWYYSGDVEFPTDNPTMTFRMSAASAAHVRQTWDQIGALIAGRRTFDIAHGWEAGHPLDAPIFVVTHTVPDGWPRADVPLTFVTDGVERAVEEAKAVAGDRNVAVTAGTIGQQCLDAGLLDEVALDLVPVLLGEGVRYFGDRATPVALDPPRVVQGDGVTHLSYRVRRS